MSNPLSDRERDKLFGRDPLGLDGPPKGYDTPLTKTVQRTLSIPAHRIKEAREDLEKLLSPVHLITFNDGYYAKSLEQKWGMTCSEMQQLLGTPRTKVVWE